MEPGEIRQQVAAIVIVIWQIESSMQTCQS